MIPASTTHRWWSQPLELLIIATRSRAFGHYVNTAGQLVEAHRSANATSVAPAIAMLAEGEDVPVLVRTRLSVHVHATHPFDVTDGTAACTVGIRHR